MKIKNKKGTSFIELIIYIAIMTIMLAAISSFIISNKKMENRNKAISETEFQSSEIMRIMTQSVRNAKSVAAPVAGASNASLSIVTDMPAKNPTVFDLSSGNIRMKEGNSPAVFLNSDKIQISNLNFQNLASVGTLSSIRFQFEAKYLNPGNRVELDYQKIYYDSATPR